METPGAQALFKAEQQNKLNAVTGQLIRSLQQEVVRLDELENDFYRGLQIHGKKYLQEVLATLVSKTDKMHKAERALLQTERQVRESKKRDFEAKISQVGLQSSDARRALEAWLRAEADGCFKLDVFARRLVKMREQLKKIEHANKTELKDLTSVQVRILKKLEVYSKDLDDLEKERKKVSSVCKNSLAEDTPDVSESNKGLREEISRMKEKLQLELSEVVLEELDKKHDNLKKEVGQLQIKLKESTQQFTKNENSPKRLDQALGDQKKKNEELLCKKTETLSRIESQHDYLAEIKLKRDSLQSRMENIDSGVQKLGKFDEGKEELLKVSSALAYCKKQVRTMDEKSKQLKNTKETLLGRKHQQELQAVELEKSLQIEANSIGSKERAEEKQRLKQSIKKLSDELLKRSEVEREAKRKRAQGQKQYEDVLKDIRGMEERLEARRAEKSKADKELKRLAQDFDGVFRMCRDRELQQAEMRKEEDKLQELLLNEDSELGQLNTELAHTLETQDNLKRTMMKMVQSSG